MQALLSLSSCSGSSPSRTSTRTEIGRAGLRNPTPCIEQRRPSKLDALHRDTYSGVLGSVGNQVFTERLPGLLSTRDRLLPGGGERSTTSSSSWWTFAGLHCKHLPASTVVRYFEQHTMSTSANGAAGAFSTSPSSGYIPKRLHFIFSMSTVAIFISNLSSDKIAHVHIYATTLLCVFFWLKSNIKMSNFLTIYI